jgi:hypothetical protein
MDIGKIAGYIGSGIAIAFGAALLWFPPTTLAGEAGTVGAAFAFITGGLATFGVSVVVPVVRATALAEGERRGAATRRASRAKPPVG